MINQMKELIEKRNTLNTTPVELSNIILYCSETKLPEFSQLTVGDYTNSEMLHSSGHLCKGGKPEFRIMTKDTKGQSDASRISQGSVQSIAEVTAAQVRYNNDGSYTTSFVAKLAGEVTLSVLIEGEQIKASPYSISIQRPYIAIAHPSKVINNNGQMGQLWGIAFGRDGMWAVADCGKNCIYIYNCGDQLVKQLGTKGSNPGQFWNPMGVAFDNDGCLYVVDSKNYRVQKFDRNFNYLMQFVNKGFNSITGITVHDNMVFVTDTRYHGIFVFNTNGEYDFTIGDGQQLVGPYDVAFSSSDELYVAEYHYHSIYIFKPIDEYIENDVFVTGKYQVGRPTTLAIDVNNYVLVGDSNNHLVLVFDQSATCIHSFGPQYGGPFGIAISPNGSIYVTDGCGAVYIY